MLKHYLIVAWRSLTRNKGYAAINIAGLATGMAIALLIGLWITDEMSFDHYTPNHSRIARGMVSSAAQGQIFTGEWVSMAMGKAFRTQYADLFTRTALVCGGGESILASGDKRLSAPALWAQPELPEMFGFRILQGNTASLRDPSTVLIAQSLATALYGKADPIGKHVLVSGNLDLQIGGVYEDLPLNTTFHTIKVILPWYNKANNYHNSNTDWEDHNGSLYVELAPNVTAEQASARISQLPTPHVSYCKETAFVYPLDRAHLYSEFKNGLPDGGGIRSVRLFAIIGVFVLLLACINFMNLSTARSEKRAKEVGIRKTIGSVRGQLITQFLSESVLVALIAFGLAIVLMEIALPFFNTIAAKDMHLPWRSPLFWLVALAFATLSGLIAGSYPAFYLSGLRPILVLKGNRGFRRFRTRPEQGTTLWSKFIRAGRYAAIPRQALVVLQFTVSLMLIIGTVVVFRQILLARDRPVGYFRDGLVSVRINTPDLQRHYEALRTDLLASGLVANVGASSMTLTNFEDGNPIDWRGKRPDQNYISFRNVNVTPDYGRTIGWTIREGRDFSRDYPTDTAAMILNAAAVKTIGIIPHPVGETMKFFGKSYKVIGVVDDMISESPYDSIKPAVFLGDGYMSTMIIRIRPGSSMHSALAGMAPLFAKYNPGSPFAYDFVDDEYAKKFAAEQRVGKLAAIFTVLAIFISCLGLFGLASFVAEQRTKEIGVRKVLGAGVLTLWGLLSREFLLLVALSLVFAIPLSWWVMHQWLQNYSYRRGMPWWIFAAAGAGILLITLLTVSYQSLKAATANPVKSLRAE
jgi:putative ABC transport system permease protein